MDLFLYILISVIYIMVIHFAFAIRNEFNLWLMTTFFVIGGVFGMVMHTYEAGFVLAVVLSLIFG